MKLLWILPCLAVCACVQGGASDAQAQDTYGNFEGGYAQAQYAAQPAQQVANPYAMEPPAYENGNFVISQKEQELFQKERDLLRAQQELYEREKKLASREAEFINRSKALDYKEQTIQSGRSYAPMYQPRPAYQPAPVYQPTMPVYQPAPAYQPTRGGDVMIEDTVVYSSVSQPAGFEPTQPGYIIMQHPIQRDLVRCPASDDVCMQSYERLGYVRSANLSRYTTQDETNTSGQWRENNSVPRW